MRKQKIAAAVLVVCLSLIILLVLGCDNESTNGSNTATELETIRFTDSTGREVEVPAKINRIVPSGSLAQIVLFALAPDMLVGITNEWTLLPNCIWIPHIMTTCAGTVLRMKGDLNLAK